MRQTTRLLATVAALALPGAALFALPAFARPPSPQIHAQGLHRPPHDHGKSNLRAPVPFDGYGLPVVVPATGDPGLVTHDFVAPGFYPPPPHRFPRSIEILSDVPAFIAEPPHIIELRRHRHHRPPITVVRRGLISLE
jgi:hypothetical protein